MKAIDTLLGNLFQLLNGIDAETVPNEDARFLLQKSNCMAAIEIAAQLAKLNDLKIPRWVYLANEGMRFPIDAGEVAAVSRFTETKTNVYLKANCIPFQVDGSVIEVQYKLGIQGPPDRESRNVQ
jgi:hypothetical protein